MRLEKNMKEKKLRNQMKLTAMKKIKELKKENFKMQKIKSASI